jgi:hypothetical protein
VKTLLNGTLYDGLWDDGKFKQGKCNYPDGKSYEGDWLDGKPHGRGIKSWPDGRKYDGMWEMGKPVGHGKKIYPDGKAREGVWENGTFIEQGNINMKLKILGGFMDASRNGGTLGNYLS